MKFERSKKRVISRNSRSTRNPRWDVPTWWLFFSSFGKSHGQKFHLQEREVYKEELASQKKQARKAREIAKRIKNQQGMIPCNMGRPRGGSHIHCASNTSSWGGGRAALMWKIWIFGKVLSSTSSRIFERFFRILQGKPCSPRHLIWQENLYN